MPRILMSCSLLNNNLVAKPWPINIHGQWQISTIVKVTQKKKPYNYDIVFGENSEFKKQNTLLQVKLKAILMEEKDADLWWDSPRHCSEGYWEGLQKV